MIWGWTSENFSEIFLDGKLQFVSVITGKGHNKQDVKVKIGYKTIIFACFVWIWKVASHPERKY
jgi:hypothetical protein